MPEIIRISTSAKTTSIRVKADLFEQGMPGCEWGCIGIHDSLFNAFPLVCRIIPNY
jgi:hypothetical protein